MAKKEKVVFKAPPGTPEPWMSTFSDLMNLLLCFFVLLFSMSTVDAQKYEEVAKSFQQTLSIFEGGAKAIGDGILVSNGVSQLNMLDDYINSTGKVAQSDSDNVEFEENAEQGKTGEMSSDEQSELEEIMAGANLSAEELEALEGAIGELEEQKLAMSEQLAEQIEEGLEEAMLEEQVSVEFTSDYVLLTLNGTFLFDSGQATLKAEANSALNTIGKLLLRYADSTIEIEGHTDSVPLNGGRYENNDVLSSYRALAVFNYLKDTAGIDPAVMKHSGRGEYIPVADNSTPEGRALNRRVEIKIYNSLSAY